MVARTDVAFRKQDHTFASDVSVEMRETNLKSTIHERGKESLSISFTLLAAGFGLISDGCNFYIPCLHVIQLSLCSRSKQLDGDGKRMSLFV